MVTLKQEQLLWAPMQGGPPAICCRLSQTPKAEKEQRFWLFQNKRAITTYEALSFSKGRLETGSKATTRQMT